VSQAHVSRPQRAKVRAGGFVPYGSASSLTEGGDGMRRERPSTGRGVLGHLDDLDGLDTWTPPPSARLCVSVSQCPNNPLSPLENLGFLRPPALGRRVSNCRPKRPQFMASPPAAVLTPAARPRAGRCPRTAAHAPRPRARG